MQEIFAFIDNGTEKLCLPDPSDEVMPGVVWGRCSEFFSPAFWAERAWVHALHEKEMSFRHYKTGISLIEEVVSCLLGGYGIPAEMAIGAFRHLRNKGLLERCPTEAEILLALREEYEVKGKTMHYRFPNRRAKYISEAIWRLNNGSNVPESGMALRNFLLSFPGIGPKTASWIVRNWCDSNEVAIIDIHIHRAGVLAGFFPKGMAPCRDYKKMENRFLAFSHAIRVSPSVLDSMMWNYMRCMGTPVAV